MSMPPCVMSGLEADVALPVVKTFIASVREKAIGQDVLKSVKPGQMVGKIVHDALVEIGPSDTMGAELNLNQAPPAIILMVGLRVVVKPHLQANWRVYCQKYKVSHAGVAWRHPSCGA